MKCRIIFSGMSQCDLHFEIAHFEDESYDDDVTTDVELAIASKLVQEVDNIHFIAGPVVIVYDRPRYVVMSTNVHHDYWSFEMYDLYQLRTVMSFGINGSKKENIRVHEDVAEWPQTKLPIIGNCVIHNCHEVLSVSTTKF